MRQGPGSTLAGPGSGSGRQNWLRSGPDRPVDSLIYWGERRRGRRTYWRTTRAWGSDNNTNHTYQTDGGLIPPTPIAGYFVERPGQWKDRRTKISWHRFIDLFTLQNGEEKRYGGQWSSYLAMLLSKSLRLVWAEDIGYGLCGSRLQLGGYLGRMKLQQLSYLRVM
jgi:hypothetical protein